MRSSIRQRWRIKALPESKTCGDGLLLQKTAREIQLTFCTMSAALSFEETTTKLRLKR